MITFLRFTLAVAGVAGGALLADCGSGQRGASCGCPGDVGVGEATIQLPCGNVEPPTVNVTGTCTVSQPVGPQTLYLQGGVGACHVELTFASGVTSSTDIQFVLTGTELPCGCGEPVAATPSFVGIGN